MKTSTTPAAGGGAAPSRTRVSPPPLDVDALFSLRLEAGAGDAGFVDIERGERSALPALLTRRLKLTGPVRLLVALKKCLE